MAKSEVVAPLTRLPIHMTVDIPGLKPNLKTLIHRVDRATGRKTVTPKVVEGNIADPKIVEQIDQQLKEKPWWRRLLKDIKNDRKTAVYVVSFGTLGIFIAAGGFEFGLRDAQDVRKLRALIKHRIR